MENHQFFLGKSTISMGHLYHGYVKYVSHSQISLENEDSSLEIGWDQRDQCCGMGFLSVHGGHIDV